MNIIKVDRPKEKERRKVRVCLVELLLILILYGS